MKFIHIFPTQLVLEILFKGFQSFFVDQCVLYHFLLCEDDVEPDTDAAVLAQFTIPPPPCFIDGPAHVHEQILSFSIHWLSCSVW